MCERKQLMDIETKLKELYTYMFKDGTYNFFKVILFIIVFGAMLKTVGTAVRTVRKGARI